MLREMKTPPILPVKTVLPRYVQYTYFTSLIVNFSSIIASTAL